MIDTDVTLLFFEYSALATDSFCLSCTKGAGSAQRRDPLRDKIREVGRGALARRHTEGPLWAALLKTTVMCEAWRRR